MKAHSIIRVVGALVCAGLLHVSAASAATETVLYSFKGGSDGNTPEASLIQANGVLYGTTIYGGTGSCTGRCGTVFSITPSGTETVVYAFQSGTDGAWPAASLINVRGTLYGTTSRGGQYDYGTVFSLAPGASEKVLHAFKYGTDGAVPEASLISVNGTLYGTTFFGGGSAGCNGGCGTVFAVTAGGTETVLHAFAGGSDGFYPVAGLIDVNGTLYGTTLYGGTGCGCGTVFSITPDGTEHVVYSFKGGSDGSSPMAGLINAKGTLYGTSAYGGGTGCGGSGCGTVFSITPDGTENVLHSFRDCKREGCMPTAGVINVKGKLYGTTGHGDGGTVFSLTPGGAENVLYSFGTAIADGYQPVGLISVNGTFFGAAAHGGAQHAGMVFSITP